MANTRVSPGVLAMLALAALSACAKAPEPAPICAQARLLPDQWASMITPTGRVLAPHESGWSVRQLEADGTLTPVATLATNEHSLVIGGWLAHEPISGRMWLLEGSDDYNDLPPALYQFDAAGELEWKIELADYERPVEAGTVLYHDGSIYLSLTLAWAPPQGPADPGVGPSLLLERRDLAGAVIWSRAGYAPPDTNEELSTARLVGVSGSALSMVATPPLIDYGHSFPLTVDVATGEVLWSGTDGGDPLRMAVGDTQLHLGWVRPTLYDPERWPELVVTRPTASMLSVHAPDSGAQAELDAVEWDAIDWPYPGFGSAQSFAFGWLGEQLVSVLASAGEHGVSVHAADGALVCQGRLDVEVDAFALGFGVGIAGREQFVVVAEIREPGSDEPTHGLLLVESLGR